MFDLFLAQLLVLILILGSTIRIFVIKNARIDSLAIFSFLSLVAAFFCILCFDFQILSFFLLILSVLVFITNVRSLFRLSASIIVDHYSIVFILSTVMELILTVAVGFFVFYFCPVKYSPNDFNVKCTKYDLTGSHLSGFRIRESLFSNERFSGNLFLYENEENNENSYPVVVFPATSLGDVKSYEPLFMMLSQKGVKVMAVDFYSKDFPVFGDYKDKKIFRRFFLMKDFLLNPEKYKALAMTEKKYAADKYESISVLAREVLGDDQKIFYIADDVSFDAISDVLARFSDIEAGFLSLNRIEEYKSNGFGFPEQNDMIVAKKLNMQRDSSFFIPRYCAGKIIEEMKRKN